MILASRIPLSNGVHTCAHTYAQRKKHAAAHLYTLQLATSMTNKQIILVIHFLITLYHIVFMLYIYNSYLQSFTTRYS